MPKWDGLLPPVSCGEHPIIDRVRTPVAYSNPALPFLYIMKQNSARPIAQIQMTRTPQSDPTTLPTTGNTSVANQG